MIKTIFSIALLLFTSCSAIKGQDSHKNSDDFRELIAERSGIKCGGRC